MYPPPTSFNLKIMKSLEKFIHSNASVIGDVIMNIETYKSLQTSKLEEVMIFQIEALNRIITGNLEVFVEINSFLNKIEE